MHIRYSKAAVYLGLFLAALAASTGLLAGKAKLAPHQITIFFTGDDWGKYKYCT